MKRPEIEANSVSVRCEPAGAMSTHVAFALLVTMVWPAAAALSLSVAVGGREVTASGLALVACGTMAAYGLDRWIDNRERDALPVRRALATCVLLAAIGVVALACTAWWRIQVCAVLAVMAGAYVPLKKWIPKNVLTTAAWTTATSTLPFAARPALDPTYAATVASVACIMAANTILCDIPDVARDREAGVRGITPRFGARSGGMAAVVIGIIGTIVAISGGRFGLAATAFSLAVLAIMLVRDPARGLYRLLADAVVTFVPGPLALLFR